MVIIVSMTGIASFTIPRFNFAITVRLLRFPIMLLAGALGLYGIVIGLVLISVHLTQMTSFGVPYLSGLSPYHRTDTKDIVIRTPWWRMINRPSTVHHDKKRMNAKINGSPEAEEGGKLMHFMQKYRTVVLLFLCTLLLSGCWDREEINDIAFVIGIAVDKEKQDYRTSLQIALPGQSGASGSEGGGEGQAGTNPGSCCPQPPKRSAGPRLKGKRPYPGVSIMPIVVRC